MTTWEYATNTIRHPWFMPPSLKRKHTESSSDDDEAVPVLGMADSSVNDAGTALDSEGGGAYTVEEEQDAYPTPPSTATADRTFTKRRRCDTIERKMARMQIGQDTRTRSAPGSADGPAPGGWKRNELPGGLIPQAPGMTTASSASSIYSAYSNYSNASLSQSMVEDLNPAQFFHPSMVEEPVSPEFVARPGLPTNNYFVPQGGPSSASKPVVTEDIRMKGDGPAWYEREKDCIVITDLDEAIAEAEEEERLAKAANPSTSSYGNEDEYKPETDSHPYSDEFADSNADFSLAELLFQHIKRQANFPYKDPATLSKMRAEAETGALVLFRPALPPPIPEDVLNKAEELKMEELKTAESSGGKGMSQSTWQSNVGTTSRDEDIDVDKIVLDRSNLPPANGVVLDMPMADDAMDIEL